MEIALGMIFCSGKVKEKSKNGRKIVLFETKEESVHHKKQAPLRKSCLFRRFNSLAGYAAKAANKVLIVFGRGVYVDKNTSQAASVEFVCRRQTNYARSRLQKTGGKARRDFSPSQTGTAL